MSDRNALFARRQRRTRYALRQASNGRPRLSVFRSGKHIYAQVIDDRKGVTLAAASTLDKDVRGSLKTGADKGAAAEVGKLIAARAVAAGCTAAGSAAEAVAEAADVRVAVAARLRADVAAQVRE